MSVWLSLDRLIIYVNDQALMLPAEEPGHNKTEAVEELSFHPRCGSQADVIASGKTARRRDATDEFNKGVVLTARPLLPNEMFEVENSETSLCRHCK